MKRHKHEVRRLFVRPATGTNSDINVTPLVDVVLVLLIIFMVVTPLLEKDIPVRTPTSEKVEEVVDVPQDQTRRLRQQGRSPPDQFRAGRRGGFRRKAQGSFGSESGHRPHSFHRRRRRLQLWQIRPRAGRRERGRSAGARLRDGSSRSVDVPVSSSPDGTRDASRTT